MGPNEEPQAVTLRVELGETRGNSSTSYAPMVGGYMMPISSGPHPHLQFNAEDQAAFVDNLARILSERGVVRPVPADGGAQWIVTVKFLRTEHFPEMQDYVLDAVVVVQRGGVTRFEQLYRASTIEGVNVVARMFQNAIEGRKNAAELLLKQVVPDLERINWE